MFLILEAVFDTSLNDIKVSKTENYNFKEINYQVLGNILRVKG